MLRRPVPLFLCIFLTACSTVPIEQGAVFGPLTTAKDGFTSSFVALLDDGSAVVFDAGFSGSGGPIIKQLEALGADAGDVARIFITHGHGDHVAGLGAFPEAEIHAMAEEASHIAEEAPEGITVTVEHDDGDIVSIPPLTVEVLHLPGHTPGTAVYFVGGALVMGDAAVLNKDGSISTAPDRFDEDPEQALSSLRGLVDRLAPRRAELEHIVFAHSGGLSGDAARRAFFDTQISD